MSEELAQAVDNRESEAEPATAIRPCELVELAENVPLLIVRDAGSTIPYVYAQMVAPMAAADHNTATPRVAHRVGHQVQHYPFEQNEIAAHPGAARYYRQA